MNLNRQTVLRSVVLGALCVASFAVAGCGGGVPDPHYPYGEFTATVVGQMTGQVPIMGDATLFAGVVGEKEIGGRTYSVYLLGHDIPEGQVLNATVPGTIGWVQGLGTNTLTLGGFSTEVGLTGIADPPVVLNLDPPVGVPQTVNSSAMITTTTDPVGQPATFTATYTLVEENVDHTTAQLGTVSGVKHFQGSVTVSGAALPAIVTNSTATVDVWYSPTLGVVDAISPELGMNLGQEGQNDWTVPDEDGIAIGRMVTVLDATNTYGGFSTWDRAQTSDADKCVHCKMLAEVRYANESDALTLGEPDSTLFRLNMTGGMGQFCWGACPLIESSVSIFHPEENGKGYKYWYVYVDEALKNEYQEGGSKASAYSINYSTDPGLPPIRITARIAYALASESSDCSM